MSEKNIKLVIAEKPSVAQYIAKVIGADKREDGYLEGKGCKSKKTGKTYDTTAANAQSQRLLVISSQEAKEKLSKGVNYHGAPLAIIVCGDHSDVFVRPFDKKDMVSVDATIVADHIVLEAEDLGLSSCWLTYFDPEIIRNEFNIPSNLEPIAIIAVGYADTEKASPDRHSKDRKALESLVCYETF